MGAKITLFSSRINQYQQNWTFANNQGRSFQRLNNEEENYQCEILNTVWAQRFWKGIWSERKEHYKDAEWVKDPYKELEQDEDQDKIHITKDKMMKMLRKMSNWKATGHDSWLKNLTPLLDKLLVYFQDYLHFGEVTD